MESQKSLRSPFMSGSIFEASGKFLLFGEYLVLRGGDGLAMPLRFGQNLKVEKREERGILWQSFEHGVCWLEILFSDELELIRTTDLEKAQVVRKLLCLITRQKPDLSTASLSFRFNLNFDRGFGMGTSATLISLLSQWSGVDPYFLLEKTFGGSGYDIAAATAREPFIYSVSDRLKKNVILREDISENLVFVYLGAKQNSFAEVVGFRDCVVEDSRVREMNHIVQKAVDCSRIENWEKLMRESERLLSGILRKKPVRMELFNDYPYEIKSLGAWGGDFIMASCRNVEAARDYFNQKNKNPVFTWRELIR